MNETTLINTKSIFLRNEIITTLEFSYNNDKSYIILQKSVIANHQIVIYLTDSNVFIAWGKV